MFPIIKIRLIYIKRHFFKNLFQFFYPVIFTAIFAISINKFTEKREPVSKSFYPNMYELYDVGRLISIRKANLGIICQNQKHRESMIEFAKQTICDNITHKCEIKAFTSNKEYNSYIRDNDNSEFMSIIDVIGDNPQHLKFTIQDKRLNVKSIHITSNTLLFETMLQLPDNNVSLWSSYQIFFANYLMKINQQKPKRQINVYEKALTIPKIYNIFASDGLINSIPMLISLSYSSTLFAFVVWMVSEKEQRLNDFLYRQGITHNKYLLSWLNTFIIITIVPTIITSYIVYRYLFFKVKLIYILLSQVLFSLNIFGMSLLFQSLVNSIQTGQSLLKVLYIGVTILSNAIIHPKVPFVIKVLFSFFPQITQLANFELLIVLDNYEKIDFVLATTKLNGISLLNTYALYIFTFVIYIAVSKIISKYKEHNMDIFSYIMYVLLGCKRNGDYSMLEKRDVVDNEFQSKIDNKTGLSIYHEDVNDAETQFKNSKQYLHIKGVSKYYGDLIAVNNFNCELYPNEIFCLLGHNGAGKTTLIKMLSGLEQIDKGDISLNMNSLVSNKSYLYKNIGLCSQDDVFFEYLTVVEHMTLMSEIKGERANMTEILELLFKIDLYDKKDSIASTLSGGQKRKLCIALALVGNSKLVLLDEPTSGMDVVSKRALWNFLKLYKKDRIMILTTHSLDEAEELGDRIGIVSEGRFICSGSAEFLKSKYPCGYNVNIIFNENDDRSKRVDLARELKLIDDSAIIKINSKSVLSINFSSIESEHINKVFSYIDSNKGEYLIENYTVSTTSLEDVFLKLNNNEMSNNLFNDIFNTSPSKNGISDTLDIQTSTTTDVNNNSSITNPICRELIADIKRNVIPLWRNKSNFILEVISASVTIFIYILGFNSQLTDKTYNFQNLNTLLQLNELYIKAPDHLITQIKKSYYVTHKLSNKLKLHPITFQFTDEFTNDSNYSIDDLDKLMFDNHPYKNERAVVGIKESASEIDVFILYQSISSDYYHAIANLVLSSLMEGEYKIKASFGEAYATIQSAKTKNVNDNLALLFLVFMSIFMIWNSLISLSGFMIATPLKERINNIKHLLYLSGANMYFYWISLAIVDFFKYVIFLLLVMPLLIWLDKQYWYHLLMFIPFIFALSFFIYCLSFVFDKEEHGQKIYILFSMLISVALPFLTVIRIDDKLMNVLKSDNFFISESDLFPASSLLFAMVRICLISQDSLINLVNGNSNNNNNNVLFYATLNHIVIFIGQSIVYALLLLLFQKRIIPKVVNFILVNTLFKFKRTYQTDIENINPSANNSNELYLNESKIDIVASGAVITTKIHKLKKTYCVCCGKNIRAVDKLSLLLESNEKFGLLGFNGSGKTTTFKCITNELFFDSGDITLFGKDIKKDFHSIRQSIGYCPQENALFDYSTVKETLMYFAELNQLQNYSVYSIAEKYNLSKYLNTTCRHLSGGNQRKLSFAIALMNNPKILLLDEPSTGVDPESRRVMWKNINALSKSNDYNMILSTHSMEEAEILCDTVTWLKKGKVSCYGNPEKLKLKFSAGYNLHIKFIKVTTTNEEYSVEEDDKYKEIYEVIGSSDMLTNQIDKGIGRYIDKLFYVINNIKCLCEEIKMIGCDGGNGVVDLLIYPIESYKGKLFSMVLNIKHHNKDISEISINMESLENILTKQ